MKRTIRNLGLGLIALLLPLPAAAAELGEVVEYVGADGGVNWTRAQAVAEGTGYAKPGARNSRYGACRAGVGIAQRNLLEVIKGVRIEGETLIQNGMLKSDAIRTTVNGVLKGARVKAKVMEKDGGCRVTIGVPMAGPLAKSVYQEYADDKETALLPDWKDLFAWVGFLIPSAHAAAAPWESQFNSLKARIDKLERMLRAAPSLAGRTVAQGDPTGFVIDARGSNFIPSMKPKLRKVRGHVLYPAKRHAKSRENGRLVSLFMNDLVLAQNHPRVGERPLVLKALKTWGKYRTEIVLGKGSSAKVEPLIKKGLLDSAEVIIVLD